MPSCQGRRIWGERAGKKKEREEKAKIPKQKTSPFKTERERERERKLSCMRYRESWGLNILVLATEVVRYRRGVL